jgi:hypothetical protein
MTPTERGQLAITYLDAIRDVTPDDAMPSDVLAAVGYTIVGLIRGFGMPASEETIGRTLCAGIIATITGSTLQ